MESTLALLVPIAGILALGYAFLRSRWVTAQPVGTERMAEIAADIQEGANAFLRREYRVLAIFVIVVASLLLLANLGRADSSPLIALSFTVGALCSALAGFFGMRVGAASVITNFGAGMTGDQLSHDETKRMAPLGGERLGRILTAMIEKGAFNE